MRLPVLTAAFLMSACSATPASPPAGSHFYWTGYQNTASGRQDYYFDASSLKDAKPFPSIWTKAIFEQEPQGAKAIVTQWEVDCDKRAMRVVKTISQDSKGAFLQEGPTTDWSDVVPQSGNANVFGFACSGTTAGNTDVGANPDEDAARRVSAT